MVKNALFILLFIMVSKPLTAADSVPVRPPAGPAPAPPVIPDDPHERIALEMQPFVELKNEIIALENSKSDCAGEDSELVQACLQAKDARIAFIQSKLDRLTEIEQEIRNRTPVIDYSEPYIKPGNGKKPYFYRRPKRGSP